MLRLASESCKGAEGGPRLSLQTHFIYSFLGAHLPLSTRQVNEVYIVNSVGLKNDGAR